MIISFEEARARRKSRPPLHKGTRFSALPGKVVLDCGSGWGSLAGNTLTWSPKAARKFADALHTYSRHAENLEAEARGGPPILIHLRKLCLDRVVLRVAEKWGIVADLLCFPLAPGDKPGEALVDLWRELHQSLLPFTEIGGLWSVSANFVRHRVRKNERRSGKP